MTYAELIPELLRTMPEFHPDESDVQDAITYMIFSDFVDFLFRLDPNADLTVIRRGFAFLEQAAQSPDQEAQMLMRDVGWKIMEDSNLSEFKRFLGPAVRKLVKQAPAGR